MAAPPPGRAPLRAPVAIATALVAGLVVLGLTQTLTYVVDEPVSSFTRDYQAVAQVPWYTGVISVFNNMIWTNVAVLSLFVAWLVPARRRRLMLFGGFTLALGADDALVLHDALGPANGVPEMVFFVVYPVVAVAMLGSMLQDPNRAVAVTFLLGAALLTASVVFDLWFLDQHLIEDGAKLLGSLVWLTLPMIAVQPVPEEGPELE